MGQSTDAILAFGVDLGEDGVFPEGSVRDEDYPELGAYLARRAGYTSPFDDIPHEINYGYGPEAEAKLDEWKRSLPRDFDEWYDEWYDAAKRFEEEAPIEIVRHCSYECSMYVVALRGTVTTARRGYPERLTGDLGDSIKVPRVEQIYEAQRFCEENDLLAFDDPGWLLFSMWG